MGVLVAAGMGALLLAALSQGLLQTLKGAKQVDSKFQVQDFHSLMRLNSFTPDACKKMLKIDSNPIVIAKADLIAAAAGTPYALPLSSLIVAQNEYFTNPSASQNITGGIKIKNINVNLVEELKDDLTQFQGLISYEVALASSNGTMAPQNLNLMLSLEANPADTQYTVKSCYSEIPNDGRAICSALKGRWLEATEPGSYMPEERCAMGGELKLTVNEAPDGIMRAGGRNADTGERVESCFYGASGYAVRVYDCPPNSYPRAGYRCYFDPTMLQWQYRYFDRNQNAPRPYVYATCSKGVKISLNSRDTDTLGLSESFDQSSQPNYNNPGGPWSKTEYNRRLVAVTRCKNLMDYDRTYPCINVNDPNGAVEGLAGSCIWVNNTLLWGGNQDSMNQFLGYATTALNPFKVGTSEFLTGSYNGVTYNGGWIRVNLPRIHTVDSVQEARGIPCFEVEINTGTFTPETLTDKTDAPDAALAATPTKVAECEYETNFKKRITGSPVSGTDISTFACDNEGISFDSNSEHVPKGGCWWFQDIRVVKYHTGTLGANPRKTTGHVPAIGTLASASQWSGWVYLKAPVEDNMIEVNAAAPNTAFFKAKTINSSYVTGYPCNRGVRIKN